MPKITIKYEHQHELTDLLGKLMQMYVVPKPTCGDDEQYPENYNQGESGKLSNYATKTSDDIILLANQHQSAMDYLDFMGVEKGIGIIERIENLVADKKVAPNKDKSIDDSIGKCLGTITVGESVSVLEAKLKGAEERALLVLEEYHVVCDELHCLRKKLAEEHKSADKYHDVLNQIYDILIPKDNSQHSLQVFTVDQRMNDFPALIEQLKEREATTKYRNVLEEIHNFIIDRGLLSGVSFEDGIKHFPLLISCIFMDNREMRNSLRQLGVHIATKDNTAFIAESDNQLFTLEEAAEYLEVDIKRVLNLMGTFKIKSQGFLLSDLRKIKKSWEDSV